jgi:hypothetical protein
MISNDELLQGLDRIARTTDGELLYLYLQRVLMEVPADADPSDGALRAHVGRRSFAAELMGRMARGMSERGGRSDGTADGDGPERPIVFVTKQPANVSGRLSAREHLARHDPELRPAEPKSGGD